MASIVTLTLSPALDSATSIARLCPDAKLRCSEPCHAPGGGGINVARAIYQLGGSALALFPAGGPTGLHLAELLAAEGLACQALPVSAWTRECLNVLEQSSAQQYRFVLPGALERGRAGAATGGVGRSGHGLSGDQRQPACLTHR